jgi:hypothetical protein
VRAQQGSLCVLTWQQDDGHKPRCTLLLLLPHRYSTHFPDALYGHLAALVANRPFPVAVDMSCAQQGPAGSELGRR